MLWTFNEPYKQKIVCRLKGFGRRFYLISLDHRGSVENPGRVATIVPSKYEETWGIAYDIETEDDEEFLERFQGNQVDGYQLVSLDVYPRIIRKQMFPENYFTPQQLVLRLTKENKSEHRDSFSRNREQCDQIYNNTYERDKRKVSVTSEYLSGASRRESHRESLVKYLGLNEEEEGTKDKSVRKELGVEKVKDCFQAVTYIGTSNR